jgi:hypothetical protein
MTTRKSINHNNLYIGQLVVVTEHPEATVYTIAAIEGNVAILQWREGSGHCSQGHEKFGFLRPTVEQIEYHIAHCGNLVSVNNIVEWA